MNADDESYSLAMEQYLASMGQGSGPRKPVECIQLRLGTCVGCLAADKGVELFRWRGLEIGEAEEVIKTEHCPPAVYPDIEPLLNDLASSGLGQHRGENTEGLQDIGRPSKNPNSGKVMSKAKTNRWFQ